MSLPKLSNKAMLAQGYTRLYVTPVVYEAICDMVSGRLRRNSRKELYSPDIHHAWVTGIFRIGDRVILHIRQVPSSLMNRFNQTNRTTLVVELELHANDLLSKLLTTAEEVSEL